jgi:hypothetical protein
LKDLLLRILKYKPKARAPVEVVLQHEWFTSEYEGICPEEYCNGEIEQRNSTQEGSSSRVESDSLSKTPFKYSGRKHSANS